MNTLDNHQPGLATLIKLIRLSKSASEFVNDVYQFPQWYLQNDFLKRQNRAYFLKLYAIYKRGI